MTQLNSRGVILVHALIAALLVTMVAGLLWRIALGRRTMAARQDRQSQAKAAAEAAYHRAADCLRLLDWQCTGAPAAPNNCSVCGDPGCNSTFGSYDYQFPGAPKPFRVTVEVRSDGAGRCRLDATCEGCL